MEYDTLIDITNLCIDGAVLIVLNVILGLAIYIIKRLIILEKLVMWKPVETQKLIEVKKKRGRPRKEK